MESWWQTCTHCLAGDHAHHFCALELVWDGIDLVTPKAEQHYIIRFPVKEKEKTEVLHRLYAQYGKGTLSHTNVYDWYNTFSENCKEVSNRPHAHIQPTAVCCICICIFILFHKSLLATKPSDVEHVTYAYISSKHRTSHHTTTFMKETIIVHNSVI
jgi:hypothetical protein